MRISDWRSDVCSSDLVASSAVGCGRLAQAVSASTVANARTCRPDLICAKLVAIGGSRSRGSAAIVISIRRNRNDSLPGSRGSLMDIGYFLKLMTEKNASDMFLKIGRAHV